MRFESCEKMPRLATHTPATMGKIRHYCQSFRAAEREISLSASRLMAFADWRMPEWAYAESTRRRAGVTSDFAAHAFRQLVDASP